MKVPTEAEMQAMRERLEIRGSSVWWKVRPSNRTDMTKPAGTPIGRKSLNGKGYLNVNISVDNVANLWRAHRIVWFLHHGVWPIQMLDHKDQDKQNNDPENLRLATYTLNEQNTGVRKNNALGIKGVCKHGNVYIAYLDADGKHYRKRCSTLQEAIEHRKHLEKTYHPWSPNVV